MYRLTVLTGQGRGTSFKLKDGENSIGRQLGNVVVLPSSQVSKRHCTLVASNGEILVRDQGSANGTYVNGVLVKSKAIKPGDRIGVGEFILELSEVKSPRQGARSPSASLPSAVSAAAPAHGVPDNLLQFPTTPDAALPAIPASDPLAANSADFNAHAPQAPKDLKSRAIFLFENYVMSFFYGLNLKNEWRVLCVTLFAVFLLINLLFSVQPLLDANSSSIVKETSRRAAFMARVIASRNSAPLAQGDESKTDLNLPFNMGNLYRGGHEGEGAPGNETDGVTLAVLTDLNRRVIAPPQRKNQELLSGAEAAVAKRAASLFRRGQEAGIQLAVGDTVVAVEPVKILRGGKNETVAMAIVGLDTSLATLSSGEIGVVYSETLILTSIVGAILLMILYRLTLKPFQQLGEDMDKALKGDLGQVTHEFRFEELNPLWDLINSSLQRIPRASSHAEQQAASQEVSPEQFIGPLRGMADTLGMAVAVCSSDRKVVYMSSGFEKITGIRAETAIAQDFSQLGTDESIGQFIQELLDKTAPGGDAVSEDKEFSGTNYQTFATAFGAPGDSAAKAFVLTIVQKTE